MIITYVLAILAAAAIIGGLWLFAWWVDHKLPALMDRVHTINRRVHAAAHDADRRMAVRFAAQIGAVSVDTIIMVFVAIVILYQLIPQVSADNTTVQNSANVSAMGKFSAALGEWMFPLFGLLGLVFLLWNKRGSFGTGGGKGKRGKRSRS